MKVTIEPDRPGEFPATTRQFSMRQLLCLGDLAVLAERVAYHFENQQHPLGDAARAVLAKMRGA